MAEPEKMEALKRAYAETILNTAKEAAARVMAAELRARRLEQDLVSAKEEATRMLLRLKRMFDAKNKEAEITSLNKQRKCNELESQLNEAEGIILDLRAELTLAKEQLDESQNKILPSVRQSEDAELDGIIPNGAYTGNELFKSSVNSGPEFIPVDGKNSCLDQNCCVPAKQSLKLNSECDVYSSTDHPLLEQIKEPELLRNGCTQRIFATDSSLVQEKFPVGDKPNPSNHSTNMGIVNAAGSSTLEERVQHGKSEAASVVRRSVRKRKLKFWDDFIAACGLRRSYQFKKPRQDFPHDSCYSASKVKRCSKSGGGQFQAEDDATQIEESLDCAKFPKNELVSNEDLPENKALSDVSVKQDELAAMFELASSSRIDCDVESATTTKVSNLSPADGKKNFRYTFSRKWKKKSMIYPEESSSFGESVLQRENGNSDFHDSTLLAESYRDSRQLVQVAHQLIALSESGDSTSRSAEEI